MRLTKELRENNLGMKNQGGYVTKRSWDDNTDPKGVYEWNWAPGNHTIYVSGEPIDGPDVRLVIDQAECSVANAIRALRENNNDVCDAILALKGFD